MDLVTADRSPVNLIDKRPDAYSLWAFVIGVGVGYRFNEYLGLEGEWIEAQHRAQSEWGRVARYTTGAVALRAALPLRTRQTPVLKVGVAMGRFAYGASSGFEPESNDTLVVGPFSGIVLEHELLLGLVATFEIDYCPLFRKGMDGELLLQEVTYHGDGTETIETIDSKDFTDDTFVHLLWLKIGVNFEWTLK